MAEIVYEVLRAVTLDRGSDRISLRPGARLKIDSDFHDFSEPQLQRAIEEGKLRADLVVR